MYFVIYKKVYMVHVCVLPSHCNSVVHVFSVFDQRVFLPLCQLQSGKLTYCPLWCIIQWKSRHLSLIKLTLWTYVLTICSHVSKSETRWFATSCNMMKHMTDDGWQWCSIPIPESDSILESHSFCWSQNRNWNQENWKILESLKWSGLPNSTL